MSDNNNKPIDVNVSLSGDNPSAALALLYLQSIDLTGKKPAEIAVIYKNALDEIRSTLEKIKTDNLNAGLADYLDVMGFNQ